VPCVIPNVSKDQDCALTITNNTYLCKWILSLNEEHRQKFSTSTINYKFDIFVVGSENKNFLYRRIKVDLADLINYEKLLVDHKLEIEQSSSKIMLVAKKFFETQGVKTVYDSEI
jgi:hypothetical protein